MGKVILFENTDYDYTNKYRCYDIDRTISYSYVLLYDDPVNPLEIKSIMNVDTDYYVTLIYYLDDEIYIIYIRNDMSHIQQGVKSLDPIKTQFHKVYLTKHSMRVNNVNTLEQFPKIDPNEGEIILPPSPPLDYISNYTDKGAEAFIQEHIEKRNECDQTDELERRRNNLDSFISKCELKKKQHKNTIHELLDKYQQLQSVNKKLYAEINKSKETKSNKTGSNIFELLVSFGIFMFLYCIYISL